MCEFHLVYPLLLSDPRPTPGRGIEWAEIDDAELPLFGDTRRDDLPPAPQFGQPVVAVRAQGHAPAPVAAAAVAGRPRSLSEQRAAEWDMTREEARRTIDAAAQARLVDMGFERAACVRALELSGGNVDGALADLITQQEQEQARARHSAWIQGALVGPCF